MAHSKDDAARRALKEAQVEAQRLIEAVQSALKSDADLLSEEQLVKLEGAISLLQIASLGDNRRHITLAMDELEAETKEFAAQRMDKSIRNAFSGKSIEEIERTTVSSDQEGKSA